MQKYTYSTSLMGYVTYIDAANGTFRIETRSGEVEVRAGSETEYRFLRNTDNINRDSVAKPDDYNPSIASPEEKINIYIKEKILVSIYGIYVRDEDKEHFDARIINIAQAYDEKEQKYYNDITHPYDINNLSRKKSFLFEDGHWWLTQISSFADTWLNYLFKDQKYDFTQYQTNIGITGKPITSNRIQESATLSRLIYGLSSAYLLTGCKRYLEAASRGVAYQRAWFKSLSNDGQTCFWAYGRSEEESKINIIMASQNSDDFDTIPLYEQIYCLAGLAQYYRITYDWEVLNDIKNTINAFKKFFYDDKYKGFFSHLDYATLTCDSPCLKDNQSRKNWNSVGDHLPAYLINLLLALDPLPKGCSEGEEYSKILNECREMIVELSDLIVEKFPNRDSSPFVNEKFKIDWEVDNNWKWQQDRAICGHNLKIAWNLTRVANSPYLSANDSKRLIDLSADIADKMGSLAIDQARGGVFDAVERNPKEGSFIEFAWGNTKDFWQQEQGILAYLIMYGHTGNNEYLKLARETMFFWNLYFLDMDRGGIYFRTTDDGLPVIQGNYANKGGHSVAGYHALELSFLAHVYIRSYVTKEPFCLFFNPDPKCGLKSINVLPDFFEKEKLKITKIIVNGIERSCIEHDKSCDHYFQVELTPKEIAEGAEIMVELEPIICP